MKSLKRIIRPRILKKIKKIDLGQRELYSPCYINIKDNYILPIKDSEKVRE